MPGITDEAVERYLDALLPSRAAVFLEMEREAEAAGFPAVGPQVGRLLELLARLCGAKRILELGSGFGYSALWLALALPPDGRIVLTDTDPQKAEVARRNFARLGLSGCMEYRIGPAMEILRGESGPLDLIFNDIDKEEYPQVIDLAWERLRPGGLFITDNTLWDGKAARPGDDPATAAIRRFNETLQHHPGFHTVQLPLRDGLAVALKR